jgi:putative ABC transport system ATP-binding protein
MELAEHPHDVHAGGGVEVAGWLIGELHSQGQTVVLVTHEPDIAEHALRMVVLRDGRVDVDRPTSRVAADAA